MMKGLFKKNTCELLLLLFLWQLTVLKALLRYFAGPSASIVFGDTNKVSIQI